MTAPTTQIRPLDPYSPGARDLLAQSDAYLLSLYPPTSVYLESPDGLAGPNVTFVGVFEDETLAGCGAVKLLDDDGVYGELKRIFVPPQHRGRGHANKLMTFLEARLREQRISVARLETGPRQPEALALYRKLGYSARGPFGKYPDDPLSVFMEKRLDNA